MNQRIVFRTAFGVSILSHVWAIAAAPTAHLPVRKPAQPDLVFFTAEEPPAIPKEPEVLSPQPPPEPEVVTVPKPDPVPPPLEPTRELDEPEAAPPAEPLVPELTGTTLVAEGEGGFSAQSGNGEARRGAIRAGNAPHRDRVARKEQKQPRPVSTEIPVVPVAQLAKRPVPPALGEALRRNYPLAARRQGKSGEAKVQAMLDARGRITQAVIAVESADGFGEACRKTVLGSRWTAPRDAAGKPVATWISYRCKFRIDD